MRQFPIPHEPYDGSVEETPLVQLWYGLLADSLKRKYERLHVLPPETSQTFSIRAYAQGACENAMAPPAKIYPAFLRRLKAMASFNLARRLPIERGRFLFADRGAVFEIGVTVEARADGSEEAVIDLPSEAIANEE